MTGAESLFSRHSTRHGNPVRTLTLTGRCGGVPAEGVGRDLGSAAGAEVFPSRSTDTINSHVGFGNTWSIHCAQASRIPIAMAGE